MSQSLCIMGRAAFCLCALLCASLPVATSVSAAQEATARPARPPAASTASTWIMTPVILDSNVTKGAAAELGVAVRDAWRATGDTVIFGSDEILQRSGLPEVPRPRISAALKLIEEGENLYMSFEFATAAAALAEAVGQLSAHLGSLATAEVEQLLKARAFEAVAWLETGDESAALEAFSKLLTIRPDYQADRTHVPPAALAIMERARKRILSRGTGTLHISTVPPGAHVWLDGRLRGKAPLTIRGLPLGSHHLRVAAPGRELSLQTIQSKRGAHAHEVKLRPGPLGASATRLASGIKVGAPAATLTDDLARLHTGAQLRDIVTMAIGSRGTQQHVVTAVRWRSGHPVSGVAFTQVGPDMQALARDLVRAARVPRWPPLQLPPDGPQLDLDFSRSAMGMGPTWGRTEVVEESSVLGSWWFWTGAVALAGGAAAAYMSRDRGEAPIEEGPSRVRFSVEY